VSPDSPIPRFRFFHVRESRILPDMSYYTPEDQYAAARREMVDRQIRARGIVDPRVLAAMTEVPRHRFLPRSLWPSAYRDTPLPIGENQTISQPYIIALMTEALELAGRERILEIGTGVGYQTAILAELGGQVFTIERLPTLARAARSCLRELGYGNVETLLGDGTLGLPDQAPFDRILATQFGATAADLVAAGTYGRMAALRGSRITSVPMDRVAGKPRLVPRRSPLIQAARAVGTVFAEA